MPPPFREFVEDGMILTRGMEGCLYIFPLAAWKRVEEQLEQLPLTDASSRAFVRFFYSGASKSRLDAQSRVSVPGPLTWTPTWWWRARPDAWNSGVRPAGTPPSRPCRKTRHTRNCSPTSSPDPTDL